MSALFSRGPGKIQTGAARAGRNISFFGTATVTDSSDTFSRQLDEWSTGAGSAIELDIEDLDVSLDGILRREPPLAEIFLVCDDPIKD